MDSNTRADIADDTAAAAATVDGSDIEPVLVVVRTGFELGLAIVESESEPEEVKTDDEADAEIQPEGTMEIGVDVTTGINIPNELLIANAIKRSEQLEEGVQAMTITFFGMSHEAIKELITQIVNEALANQEANRNARPVVEGESQNGDDMVIEMVEEIEMENDKIERFIWGLPDNIKGNVTSSKPSRLQEAIKMSNSLMDQKPPFKIQNVVRAFTVGNNDKRRYSGTLPYCSRCKLHHEGPCTVKCTNCKKIGHMARDCKTAVVAQTPRALVENKRAANNDARGRAYALGRGDGYPDSNVITGMFLLNNRYAHILFESSADKSFVSITFSALIDITPTTLDVSYTVELADGRIAGLILLLGVVL
nr:reverse transcriptase domain-containing protein [Tanacetum cinerariifolium]